MSDAAQPSQPSLLAGAPSASGTTLARFLPTNRTPVGRLLQYVHQRNRLLEAGPAAGLSAWRALVAEFFAPHGVVRITACPPDGDGGEQAAAAAANLVPFEALPHLLHARAQSGLQSLRLCLGGLRELPHPAGGALLLAGHALEFASHRGGAAVATTGKLRVAYDAGMRIVQYDFMPSGSDALLPLPAASAHAGALAGALEQRLSALAAAVHQAGGGGGGGGGSPAPGSGGAIAEAAVAALRAATADAGRLLRALDAAAKPAEPAASERLERLAAVADIVHAMGPLMAAAAAAGASPLQALAAHGETAASRPRPPQPPQPAGRQAQSPPASAVAVDTAAQAPPPVEGLPSDMDAWRIPAGASPAPLLQQQRSSGGRAEVAACSGDEGSRPSAPSLARRTMTLSSEGTSVERAENDGGGEAASDAARAAKRARTAAPGC